MLPSMLPGIRSSQAGSLADGLPPSMTAVFIRLTIGIAFGEVQFFIIRIYRNGFIQFI